MSSFSCVNFCYFSSPIKTIPLNGQAIENNVESAPVNYITNVSPNTAKASKKSRKRKLTEEGAQVCAAIFFLICLILSFFVSDSRSTYPQEKTTKRGAYRS